MLSLHVRQVTLAVVPKVCIAPLTVKMSRALNEMLFESDPRWKIDITVVAGVMIS